MEARRLSKSEATRERILAAALGLFAEKGFAQTTVREIAARAECSLGLAYRYFATKDAMALALYERLVAEFAEEAAALPPGTLAQRWARAAHGDIARLAPHRGALMGLISAGLTPGSATQVLGSATTALRQRMLAIFSGIVSGAQDTPRADVAEALATLFYALHLLLVLFWLQDPTPNQRATRQLIDVSAEMLGRLRLLLRLPWTAGALVKLAAILAPVLNGSEGTQMDKIDAK